MSEAYLDQKLDFLPDRIVVAKDGTQVMMAWERPLMTKMAQIVAARRGHVLEVGFGMGLSADAVDRLRPKSHTIVEAHPQIIERAQAWAQTKQDTRIVEGRWQDRLEALRIEGGYDGILFDVFGGKGQREAFFEAAPSLLAPSGVIAYWIGDDRDISPSVRAVLDRNGFKVRLTRISAVPTADCTYSRTNEFVIPVIQRG